MKNETPAVFFFANGNTAVCVNGQQVPELQESWFLLYVKFLKSKGCAPAEFTYNLPSGRAARLVELEGGDYNWQFVP